MDDKIIIEDKYLGCLLGGAIGDALGAPIEFMSLEAIREEFGHAGVTGFHPAYGKLGAITDDTQMTLFTAEGLLRGLVRHRARGISGAEVAIVHASYRRWLATQTSAFHEGSGQHKGWLIGHETLWSRRAPGNTCINALMSDTSRGSPANNDRKDCGTVMRVAPIGLLYDGDHAYQTGHLTSELTHGHATASISAGVLCLIISQLRQEFPLQQAVNSALETAGEKEREFGAVGETSRAIEMALSLAMGNETPSPALIETLGGAWVAEEALAISIYCALVARDFSHGVLLAVNHSGDSDSTGAITGNILGLIYGQHQIPREWRDRVELNEVITQIAYDLIDVPNNYFPDDDDRPEYCAEIFKRYPGC